MALELTTKVTLLQGRPPLPADEPISIANESHEPNVVGRGIDKRGIVGEAGKDIETEVVFVTVFQVEQDEEEDVACKHCARMILGTTRTVSPTDNGAVGLVVRITLAPSIDHWHRAPFPPAVLNTNTFEHGNRLIPKPPLSVAAVKCTVTYDPSLLNTADDNDGTCG